MKTYTQQEIDKLKVFYKNLYEKQTIEYNKQCEEKEDFVEKCNHMFKKDLAFTTDLGSAVYELICVRCGEEKEIGEDVWNALKGDTIGQRIVWFLRKWGP